MKSFFKVLFLAAVIGGIFLTTLAQVPPPTNLTATNYTGPMAVIAVQLNWQAPSAPTPVLFKFNIYRKNGGLNEPGNFDKKYSNVQMTQFVDAQVQLGSTYSYYVSTVAPNGESGPSNKVQITVTNNLQRGIIAGVLTKDVTNEPIAGAKIYFWPAGTNPPPSNTGFMFTTDNLGKFKAILPPASYIMKSSAAGYLTEYYDDVLSQQQATPILLNSQDSIFVSVSLAPIVTAPPAIIAGLLTADANGSPVVRGKIHFIPTLGPSPAVVLMAITDSFGIFRKSLPAGSYYVRSEAMGYIPEFYDNVSAIQQATPIVAASGDSAFLNISLASFVPPTIYTLSGNVSDSAGNPLRAMVTAYPLRANSHLITNANSISTDSLGNYSIGVKEGDTVVVYCRPRNADFLPEFYNNKRTFSDADRIYVNGNIAGINFILEHKPVFANGISGIVQDTLGSGVMAHITAFPKYLVPTPALPHRKIYHTNTDSSGNYLFANMIPNKYVLLANPQNGFLPTFFRYDGMPTMNRLEADSIVVTEIGIVSGINFIVRAINSNGFAEIAGTVKDNAGNNINGTYILLYDHQQQIYSFAISDKSGKFKVEGVTPGNYIVIADRMGYTSNQLFNVTVDYLNNANTSITFTLMPEGITSVSSNEVMVKEFKLYQNYPNPFNPSTSIKYSVPERTNVRLSVYNILGSEVVNLVNETKNAGEYEVEFDASKLSSGVYLYKILAGNYKATKKLILMK